MIEQWQELQNKSIPEEGYQQAIRHYTNLKDKMLDQITAQAKGPKLTQSAQKFRESLEKDLLKEATNWGESYVYASDVLDAIPNAAARVLESADTSEFQQIINRLREKTKALNKSIQEQNLYFKTQLRQQQSNLLQSLGINNDFINTLLGSANVKVGDLADLQAQVISYFTRYLYVSLFPDANDFMAGDSAFQLNIFNSRTKYIYSMGGFYKELCENNILTNKLSHFLNVYHGGPKKNELDVIITELDDIGAALSGNEELVQTIEALNDTTMNEIIEGLYQDINWFGEQVKSSTLGASTIFHIGNRQQLFNSFIDEGASEYSSLQALHFLARSKNILLALGAANVLMSTNGQRQWMADFITEFREKGYYLSFLRSNDKSPLTAQVALEQYYTGSRKSARKRFLQ